MCPKLYSYPVPISTVNLLSDVFATWRCSRSSLKLYQQVDNTSKNAIDITTAIPKTSSVAKKVEEAIGKWRTEWNNNETYLKEAQNALNEKKWRQAIDKANKVRLLGQEVKRTTPYWQNKMKLIIERAEKPIAPINNPPPPNPPPPNPPPTWPEKRI